MIEVDKHEKGDCFGTSVQATSTSKHGVEVWTDFVEKLNCKTVSFQCGRIRLASHRRLLLFEGRLDNANSEGEAEHDTCCDAKAALHVVFELCPEHSKQDAQAKAQKP